MSDITMRPLASDCAWVFLVDAYREGRNGKVKDSQGNWIVEQGRLFWSNDIGGNGVHKQLFDRIFDSGLVSELHCGLPAEHHGKGKRPHNEHLAFSDYVFGGAVKNGELTFSSNLNNKLWANEVFNTRGSQDICNVFKGFTERKKGDIDDQLAGLDEMNRRMGAMVEEFKHVACTEHRMNVKEKGALGLRKGPKVAGIYEVTLLPGALGCEINGGNRISKITEGGQLHRAGVQLGWFIWKVDGIYAVDQEREWPCIAYDLTKEKVFGDKPYTLTFMAQEWWEPGQETPAVAREHIQEAVRCIMETGVAYHVSML